MHHSVNTMSAPVGSDHVYENPAKLVKNIDDMKIWEKSEAYFEYIGFILAINEAVKGKSNSRGSENCSEAVLKVVNLLDKLDAKIDEIPPIQQPQRFGNVAFRTWYQKMRDDSLNLLQEILPVNLYQSIPEIVSYLVDGFGNSTRIDYGTGHEISFVMWLCCLFKIGLLKDSDKTATGCKIFPRYLDIARKLQQTYRMEPAGSHGAWSLDDYQFVPFIWGSSQLFAHPIVEPGLFLLQNVLNQYGDDYMFLTCIRYINSVKTGPFAEHSNQLWSISGVPSWSKINGGLIKMYKAEVLSKFPVIQHIVFGSLFTLKPVEQCTGLMTAKTSMIPPPTPFPKGTKSTTVKKATSVSSLKGPGSSDLLGKKESGSVPSIPSKTSTLSPQQQKSDLSQKTTSGESKLGSVQDSFKEQSIGSGHSSMKEPSIKSADSEVKEQNQNGEQASETSVESGIVKPLQNEEGQIGERVAMGGVKEPDQSSEKRSVRGSLQSGEKGEEQGTNPE